MFPLMGFDIREVEQFSTISAILQFQPFREVGIVLLKVSEMSKVKIKNNLQSPYFSRSRIRKLDTHRCEGVHTSTPRPAFSFSHKTNKVGRRVPLVPDCETVGKWRRPGKLTFLVVVLKTICCSMTSWIKS